MSGSGSTQVQTPAPSAQELALQQAQADALTQQNQMLKQQFQTQNLLAPFVYKQLGLTPTMDDKGNITSFSQDPTQQKITDLNNQVQQGTLQYQLNALNGNLPIDPSVTQNLDTTEQQLRSNLEENLGPGYETSTPGIQALAQFAAQKNSTLFAARTGQMTLGSQLAASSASTSGGNLNNLLNSLGFGSSFATQSAGAFGQVASGFGNAQQPFLTQQQLGTQASLGTVQANQARAGQSSAMVGAGVGAVGALAAAGIIVF